MYKSKRTTMFTLCLQFLNRFIRERDKTKSGVTSTPNDVPV